MEKTKGNQGALTADFFASTANRTSGVDLSTYTPGEIAYLAHKICNRSVASLPCKTQKTDRIKEGMEAGRYVMMPVQIIRALNKVRTKLTFSDCDATGATDRDIVVSVSQSGQGFARIFDMPASDFGVYEHVQEADGNVLPKGATQTSVWSGGVRIKKEDSKRDRAVKKINSVINSLVRYKDNGTVESNCLSDSKALEPWKLSGASNSLVAVLNKTGKTVPCDFVYTSARDSLKARRVLWDKVGASLGSALKNTILTVPSGTSQSDWTGATVRRPNTRVITKPISVMASITSSVGEARIGLASMSQVDGLPVEKETRKVMSMCDDLDIPGDVSVVQFVSANRNQCERLWRRHNCRGNLLFLYPSDKTWSRAEFSRYFANGQVKRGGVTCYHTGNQLNLGDCVVMHVDLTPCRVALSKKKQIGETCRVALESMKDRLDRGAKAKYFCFYAHAYLGHELFWTTAVKKDESSDHGIAYALGLKNVYNGVNGDDSTVFIYASTRYAIQNCIVTNYRRAGLDPIPVCRLPHVYVNMMIWHHLHPVMRHIVLTYADKVDGVKKVYRMFRPLRYYPLGDGKLSEILKMGDYDLSQFFIKGGASDDSILPVNLFGGKRNDEYEGDETSEEEEVLGDEDVGLGDVEREVDDASESDDEEDPFSGVAFTEPTMKDL